MAAGLTLVKIVAFGFATGAGALSLQPAKTNFSFNDSRPRTYLEYWQSDDRKVVTDRASCWKDMAQLPADFLTGMVRFGAYTYYIAGENACEVSPYGCLRLIFGMIEPFLTVPAQYYKMIGTCAKKTARKLTRNAKLGVLQDEDSLENAKDKALSNICTSQKTALIASFVAGLGHDIMQYQQTCLAPPANMEKSSSFLVEPCVPSVVKAAIAGFGPVFGSFDFASTAQNCYTGKASVLDRKPCPLLADKGFAIVKSALDFSAYLLNSLSQCSDSATHNQDQVCNAAGLKLASEITSVVKSGAYASLFGCFGKGTSPDNTAEDGSGVDTSEAGQQVPEAPKLDDIVVSDGSPEEDSNRKRMPEERKRQPENTVTESEAENPKKRRLG